MLFKSILWKIAYLFSAIVVLFAILVTISRMMMPLLDTHHADIEKWASELLDTPVNIGRVHLSWYGYQPLVSLDNVTVLDKKNNEPILQAQRVGVFFSIPKSVWHWKPVPSGLLIAGTDINVHKTPTGEYSIQGFPAIGGFDQQPFTTESKITETLAWLSEQQRLILRDIDIRYTGLKGEKRFVTLHDLTVNNSTLDHVVKGKAILHQDVPTEVSLTIEWDGDPLDLTHIKAKIYLYVSGLSLSQWFKEYSFQGWNIKEGVTSAKIWATWEEGALQRLQTVFQLYGCHLYSKTDKSTFKISRMSGDVGWKRDGANYMIAGNDFLVDLPSHYWPVTNFSVSLSPGPDNTFVPKMVKVGYLDLEDVQDFLFSSPVPFPEDMHKKLVALDLKGAVQDITLVFPTPWNDWQHINVAFGFKHIHTAPFQAFPGVTNLSGQMKWNGQNGNLLLNSRQLVVQYSSLFNEPLEIDQLSGELAWQQDKNNGWQIQMSSMQLFNNDAAANVKGSLSVPAEGSPVIDLKGNVTIEQAKRLYHYLPMKVFEPGLVTWLKQAFLSGGVKSANVELRGPVNEFPFDSNNGLFQITAETRNIDLHFAPDWPLLEQIDAKLLFSGRKIEINLNQAKLLGIPVRHAHAVIPYLGEDKPAILEVQANDVEADFSEGLVVVRQSPLNEKIGKMFSSMQVQGPIKLQLGLTVPLSKPEDTTVKGDLAIQNAEMDLSPWGLKIDKLSGDVHFTEQTTNATGLHGIVFDKPIQFDLTTIEKSKIPTVVQARFSTNLAVNDLEGWLKFPISKVAKGSTDVTGTVDLSNELPIEVQLQSKLKGISLDLPQPYAKKAKDEKAFSAYIIAQDKKPLQVKLLYGDMLGAALILEKKKGNFHLTSADLRLGSGDPVWPTERGLMITGTLDEMNWDKLKGYMGDSGTGDSFGDLAFSGADIQINKLNIFGQQFNQTRIELSPTESSWTIGISSEDMSGQIQIPKKMSREGRVIAKFDNLTLHVDKNEKPQESTIQPKTLPSLSITLNHVKYNDMRLGQISLVTTPSPGGQVIQSLRINSGRLDFQSSGTWTDKGTHLKGSANSPHVGDFLESLGIDAHNFVANKGSINFDLNWPGAFFSPALANMNGSMSLDLGPGRIVDIGQDADAKMGIGRMLSLFSLQTIPRRLSLDFSDVFQKGYSFDSINGDFSLRNGSAYTNNLRFKGPVARLDIIGRIGLRDKDFDLNLGVTPMDVTSGIPIAAAYLTGPVGGIAALAVNTVIGRQISKAATYHYEVKGPWTNYSIDLIKNSGANAN